MATYIVRIVDHNAPWDLTPRQRKAMQEEFTFEASCRADAIEEAEGYAADVTHEWARVSLVFNGRTIWKAHTH